MVTHSKKLSKTDKSILWSNAVVFHSVDNNIIKFNWCIDNYCNSETLPVFYHKTTEF